MNSPVDKILNQWKAYLTNISSNLMELSDQTEYRLIKLKAEDKVKGYTGITGAKALGCVESVESLWRHFAILTEVMEKAIRLNDKQSFIYDVEDDIKELFENTLFVTEREHVNINERNLLASESNEKKATPKQLLKQMQETFDKVCSDIREITEAEEALESRLINIKNEIKKLNTAALALGINNIPVFDTDRVAKVERDPLQGQLELDKLVYNLEKYRASIKVVQEEYEEVTKKLDSIKSMLYELKELAEKSRAALSQSEAVFGVVKDSRPVLDGEILKSLLDWLQVLQSKFKEGSVKGVKVGASKLEQECALKLQMEKENYEINSKAYREWLDLKGQFKALVAKSEILKSKGLLVDTQGELIEKINAAFHENPLNMERCKELVGKFKLSL